MSDKTTSAPAADAVDSRLDRGAGRLEPERSTRLRWKLEPRETGLRAIAAGPRSSWLTDGKKRYACVSALGRSAALWYWVAGWDSGVPFKNTANERPLSLENAKAAAALTYVREHLKTPNGEVEKREASSRPQG